MHLCSSPNLKFWALKQHNFKSNENETNLIYYTFLILFYLIEKSSTNLPHVVLGFFFDRPKHG